MILSLWAAGFSLPFLGGPWDMRQDEYFIHELEAPFDGYFVVETPSQWIVYQHLYNKQARRKRWKISKEVTNDVEEALETWYLTLN